MKRLYSGLGLFFVGLGMLGLGDIEGAKEHLEEALAPDINNTNIALALRELKMEN